MSPVIPHFTNECLEMLKINENLEWPKIDTKVLIETSVKFIIQINGKTRKILETKKNIDEENLMIEIDKDPKINVYIKDKKIKKRIFIPNKLINFIVN